MALHLNTKAAREHVLSDMATHCQHLADVIRAKREKIIDLLLNYESFETAEDEIWRSIDCLENVSKEVTWLSYGKADLMCTFFPVNLPLYSLTIFAFIPSFMASELVVRPPLLMRGVLREIWQELDLSSTFPNIKLVDVDRSVFNEAYVSVADVILFTGRYQNALAVQKFCPHALFIYNGAGVNPVVVTDSANIPQAVHKAIEMRTFNSGQDCAGSDIIFVHEKIATDFKKLLLTELDKVAIGDYRNRKVTVGHIIKEDQLPKVRDFLDGHAKSVVYGGKIDLEKGVVYPTVVIQDAGEADLRTTTEFFSPVFYVVIYHNEVDLKNYFSQETYADSAMYVSVFGDLSYAAQIPNSVILQEKIVNDIERGNTPYGGYGPKANFVSYRGHTYARPILISREISATLEVAAPKKAGG